MRLVVVGDPHATADELLDCQRLIDLIVATGTEAKADAVLLLGDLYHNHAVMHVEVMHFWKRAFQQINSAGMKVLALVGNHDMPGNDASTAHALLAHTGTEGVLVIDRPQLIEGMAFIPYTASHEDFLKAAKELGGSTLVCHQTFDGSTYDNGFYASDGIDQDLVPQESIVSGHIHTAQTVGKVWYPGSPRWRTLSDANLDKAIWVADIESGSFVNRTACPTNQACRQVLYRKYQNGSFDLPVDMVDGRLNPQHEWRIDCTGTSEEIESFTKTYSAPGVRIRTFTTDSRDIKVKESEGIETAFMKYLNGSSPKWGTSPEVLRKMAMERLGWS